MPFPWSESTGSPVAERVSRRGHVLDGGLALDWWSEDGVPLPWKWDGLRLVVRTMRFPLAGLSQMLCSVLSVDSSVRI